MAPFPENGLIHVRSRYSVLETLRTLPVSVYYLKSPSDSGSW